MHLQTPVRRRSTELLRDRILTRADEMSGSENDQEGSVMHRAVRTVRRAGIYRSRNRVQEARDQVVVEEPLTIEIKGIGSYTLMHTPIDAMALALGFTFTEGLISGLNDVSLLSHCPEDPGIIYLELKDPGKSTAPERNLAIMSACGICGRRGRRDSLLSALPSVGNSLRISIYTLRAAVKRMRSRQRIFSQTGGTHAATIFNLHGEVVAFGEDIARHNALDKAIGRCLVEERPLLGCGVTLSGRVSFELVAKSARAGIELISAVSAPSSLAIEAAEHSGITLCAFVRGDRAAVYSHPERISYHGRETSGQRSPTPAVPG